MIAMGLVTGREDSRVNYSFMLTKVIEISWKLGLYSRNVLLPNRCAKMIRSGDKRPPTSTDERVEHGIQVYLGYILSKMPRNSSLSTCHQAVVLFRTNSFPHSFCNIPKMHLYCHWCRSIYLYDMDLLSKVNIAVLNF